MGSGLDLGSGSGSALYEGFPFRAQSNVDLGSDSGSGLALYEPTSTVPYQYTPPSPSQCGFEFGFGRFSILRLRSNMICTCTTTYRFVRINKFCLILFGVYV